MSDPAAHPTPYPEINAVLYALLASVQTLLGEHFVGMILYGSLASGDFNPHRSDVDFLVVTAGDLPGDLLPALAEMHARLAASGLAWAAKMEGSYIPLPALRRYDPARADHPALRVDGSFDVDHHSSDWIIQRHVIRERGIALAGPDPRTLIDPVSPDDLREAARGILREWWSPMLDDPGLLRTSEYRAYAVLTMCRVLYTIQHGAVISKTDAARWAQMALGERWSALIEQALTWQRGETWDRLDDILALIRYTLEHSADSALDISGLCGENEG